MEDSSEHNRGNRIKVVAGYALQQRLGSGSFATVYKAVKLKGPQEQLSQSDADTVAIKAITRASDKLTKKVLQNLELEISILRTYQHPNIVCLHDVQKTERHFYLILEYCGGGDLQRLIRTRKTGRLSERLTRRLMRDLTAGLKFLWGQELIHRDIKPQNLLLTGPLPLDEVNDPAKLEAHEEMRQKANFSSDVFALKIADFGFARQLQTATLADTLCGSPLYMAPEILQHQRYDAKADLWSAGTVLFEMVAGRPPFNGENHMDLLRNIQRKAVRLPPEVKVSPQCVNLLRLLLNRNPLSRAGFNEFFEAADAFVALGCEGKVRDTPQAASRLGADLGTIPEGGETNNHGTGSMVTVATAYPQQRQLSKPRIPIPPCSSQTAARDLMSTEMMPPTPPPPTHLISPPFGPVSATTNPQPIAITQPKPVLANQNQMTVQGMHRTGFAPLQASPPANQNLANLTFPSSIIHGNRSNTPVNSGLNSEKPGSSEGSDDSGFVMVEHGSGLCQGDDQDRAMFPAQRMLLPPAHQMETTVNADLRNLCSPGVLTSRYYSTQHRNDSFRNRAVPRGMLSTSPRTGGAVIGMNSASALPPPSHNMEQSRSFFTSQNEAATKMLAAAEDVGRRAVQVAHLGDNRAYLAMHFVAMGESSSLLSCVPMEGVTEENDTEGAENSSFRTNSIALSTPNRIGNSSVNVGLDEGNESEEMPFALSAGTTSQQPSARFPSRPDNNDSIIAFSKSSIATPKPVAKPSAATIQGFFREALSLYVKSLQMLKGSVGASQNVLKGLKATFPGPLSQEDQNRRAALVRRCEVSANWLSSQFTGVLERANAASAEVGKLNANSADAVSIPSVEEIIYNHSLTAGRDGAVKQLLGQYEAARSSYRSAGLLAETLLMEPKLNADDRRILESYVDGFAERITELDESSRNEISGHIASAPVSRRGSGVIGVIGGMSQTSSRQLFRQDTR